MKSATLILAVLAVSITGQARQAQADIITTLYNTGVDSSGNGVTGPAVDLHYTLIQSADSSFPGPQAYVPTTASSSSHAYLAPTSTSNWVAPSATLPTEPAGTYVYQTTFNMANFIPATASITGRVAVDDALTNLTINGVSTGITYTDPGFSGQTWGSFSIPEGFSGFESGINTIDFTPGLFDSDNDEE